MTNWKKYLIFFAAGVIIGGTALGVTMYYIMKPSGKIGEGKGINTVIESATKGSTLKHSNWKVKGKQITFTTEAKGEVKGKTSIDKNIIPEVHRWNTWVNGVQLNYYGLYYGSEYHSWLGAIYMRRWQFAALNVGLLVEPAWFKTTPKGSIPIGFTLGGTLWVGGK
jgi:hypothetical protein